jgi:hypothetical protein
MFCTGTCAVDDGGRGEGVTQGLGTTKLHVQNACGFWILLPWRAGIDDDGECDASIGDMCGSTVDVCGWAQHLPWLNKAPAVPVS